MHGIVNGVIVKAVHDGLFAVSIFARCKLRDPERSVSRSFQGRCRIPFRRDGHGCTAGRRRVFASVTGDQFECRLEADSAVSVLLADRITVRGVRYRHSVMVCSVEHLDRCVIPRMEDLNDDRGCRCIVEITVDRLLFHDLIITVVEADVPLRVCVKDAFHSRKKL